MEPRGVPPPRPAIVRAGEVILGFGFSGIIFKVLDYVGRWDSAVEIYKALPHFLESGLFLALSVCLMVAGFIILLLFAKASEKVTPFQIVHPVTKLPVSQTRYLEFRRYRRAFIIALCASVTVWLCYQTRLRLLVVKQLPPSFPNAPSVPTGILAFIHPLDKPADLPKPPAPERTQPPVANSPRKSNVPDAGAVAANVPPLPPVVIPVPNPPESKPPSGKAAPRELTAHIGSKVIRGSDKAPGTLYVSVILTGTTKYHGTFDDKAVSDVMAALEKTGKIAAFTGSKTLLVNPGQQRYGVGLGNDAPETIEYFNKNLEASCDAIRVIVSGIIGLPMTCEFMNIPRSNPNASNAREDFAVVSGLDMEVEL
jgi:hypothetical protein